MFSTALQVGRGFSLLQSRAQVLQLAGLQRVQSCFLFSWEAEFLTGHFDVVVLCHSLPEQERQSIAARVHALSPSTMVVLVTRHFRNMESGMDAVLSCVPDQLVRDLPQLLGRPLAG